MRERQGQLEVPFEKSLKHRVGQEKTFQNFGISRRLGLVHSLSKAVAEVTGDTPLTPFISVEWPGEAEVRPKAGTEAYKESLLTEGHQVENSPTV